MDALTEKIEAGGTLDTSNVNGATAILLDEGAHPASKAGFLKAFSSRGETPGEIAAFVEAFLGHAVDPRIAASDFDGPLIDVCGTGSDKLGLFNLSTRSGFGSSPSATPG